MRLATVRTATGTTAARVESDHLTTLPFADVGSLLAAGVDWRGRFDSSDSTILALSDADFAPVVVAPEKIVCVGANFKSHVEEVGLPRAEYPSLFAKYSRSLIGAHDTIELPAESACGDWEVELGVVIGKQARRVSTQEALDAVAGYTIVNDVSMRDWQLRTSQFLQGKTFENTSPVGPFLVTPEEVDHARDLVMTCTVDGVEMQRASTSEMIFPVADLISYISSFITLMPGDLIATGTPAGIGAARNPAVFLKPGVNVRTAIEGLGEQVNDCSATE